MFAGVHGLTAIRTPNVKGEISNQYSRFVESLIRLTVNRMQAVQGLLNYAPNGPKDGGLMLMKGSAKLFDEFFAYKRESFDHEDAPPPEIKFMDLFLFSEKDVKWFQERGCELVKINMEPGDFVLWDSRTMHYACLPEGDQIRHVQYICMTPRRFATPETLELKKECFENFTGTTHWPHW